jgi:hypothetical protein
LGVLQRLWGALPASSAEDTRSQRRQGSVGDWGTASPSATVVHRRSWPYGDSNESARRREVLGLSFVPGLHSVSKHCGGRAEVEDLSQVCAYEVERLLRIEELRWWSAVPCMLGSPMCPSRTCPKGVCLEHVLGRCLRTSDLVVVLAPNGSDNNECERAFKAQPCGALAPHGSGTGAHDGAFEVQPYGVLAPCGSDTVRRSCASHRNVCVMHCCLLVAAHSAAAAFAPC